MLADELDYVLGVDTHRDEHVLAVVTAPAGALVAGTAAPANAHGYRELLRVADRYTPGRRAWAIEGSGSYGAGLARYVAAHGETVLEVSRTPRTERRLRGKDDTLDAARTARAALASDRLALPRTGERREALRLLLVARRSASTYAAKHSHNYAPSSLPHRSGSARNYAGCRSASCSSAAAGSVAPRLAPTSSRPGSCCAAWPAASRPQPPKPPGSNTNCSHTCAWLHRRCSTSPASDPWSPRN
jgi:hypothetical protein